jgi:hypothetical protein
MVRVPAVPKDQAWRHDRLCALSAGDRAFLLGYIDIADPDLMDLAIAAMASEYVRSLPTQGLE